MIITTSPTRVWSVYYPIFSTTYLSIRGGIPSGCCIFHRRTPCIESSRSSSPTPELNLFLSGGVYIALHASFTSLFFRVSEIRKHCSGLVIQLDSITTTGESSHDSGRGILGHSLHEISGQIVVGNSNGCSTKRDFDM